MTIHKLRCKHEKFSISQCGKVIIDRKSSKNSLGLVGVSCQSCLRTVKNKSGSK